MAMMMIYQVCRRGWDYVHRSQMEGAALERQKRLAALRGGKDTKTGPVLEQNAENNRNIRTVEEEAERVLEEAGVKDTIQVNFEDAQPTTLEDLAPKRANWDLKRDLQRKMDILDEQTQAVIIELVKKRIAATET